MPVQMPVSNPVPRGRRWDGPQIALIVFIGLGAAGFALSAWALPQPLVLPAFSVLAIALAAAAALTAWGARRKPFPARVTYWDMAGALTLIGICAALLSDSEAVIPLIESRQSQ